MIFSRIAKRHHIVSGLCLLIFFFPLLWISRYDYPSGDDYLIRLTAQRWGAWGATKWFYFNWSGRYSSFLLQDFLATHGDWFISYKIVPVVITLAGFGCLHYFLSALFGAGLDSKKLFSLSAAVYLLLVSITPDPATGFYWLPTNVQYVGGAFVSLLIATLLIKLKTTTNDSHRRALLLLTALLIAFLAGLNEISIIFVITYLASINLFHLVKSKKIDGRSLLLLAWSILFGLLACLSPGNLVRVGLNPQGSHLAQAVPASVALTFFWLAELLTSTPLLPASALFLTFLHANRERLRAPLSFISGVRWQWALLTLLCAITFANVAIFTALGVSIDSLPYRLKNVYFYGMVFGWLLFLTVLFVELDAKRIDLRLPKWAVGLLAAFVLCFLTTGFGLKLSANTIPSSGFIQQTFSLVTTRSIYANAYLDIFSGRAGRFSRQNEERERRLKEATTDPVDFPLYSYVPETIFIQDVQHPFGAPDHVTEVVSGRVRSLRQVPTGPPVPRKEGF
jgi:hypothetical protein